MMQYCYVCDCHLTDSIGPMMPYSMGDGSTVVMCTNCYNSFTGLNLREQQKQLAQWREVHG